jgi:tetratricopeptide (TPR) repeat protein
MAPSFLRAWWPRPSTTSGSDRSSPARMAEVGRGGLVVCHDEAWLVRLLVLVAMAAYLPVLGNGFVDMDDDLNFLSNYDYRGLSLDTLGWAWRTYLLGVYQPVAWMILGTEYSFCGMDPRGYHLVSVMLHSFNCVLLYYLTLALLRRAWPESCGAEGRAARVGAAFAVAIFAVHPLRVEVVAWASCQPYLPCAMFGMLTTLAYLRADEAIGGPRRAWLVLAYLLFGLALLSKAAAVGLAAVLILVDVYPLGRLPLNPARWPEPESRAILREKVPFLVIAAVFMIIAVLAKREFDSLAPFHLSWDEWSSRIAQSSYGPCFYLIKTMLPVGLSAYYPLPEGMALTRLPFSLCLGALAGAGIVLLRMRRRRPGLLLAFVSYLILLSPNLGFIRIGDGRAADRYSYIASISLVIPLAYALGRLGRAPRQILCVRVFMCIIIIGLASLSWAQCRIWRTSESLWYHAYRVGGHDSATVNSGLAMALAERGRPREAIPHFHRAIQLHEHHVAIDPNVAIAQGVLGSTLNNFGLVLSEQGEFGEALSAFRHAIVHQTAACRLKPHNPIHLRHLARHFHNLAGVQRELDQIQDAVQSLRSSRDLLERLAREVPNDSEANGRLAAIDHEISLLEARRRGAGS